MRKLKFYFFILFLLLFNKSFASINSNIEIKVGDKIITSYEIKNSIIRNLVLTNQEINQKNIDKFKKQAVESLIKKKIKDIELEKYNLTADQNRVTDYLNSISSSDIKNLKQKFKNNNISFDLFKKEIETQFKWQQLIYKMYAKNIQIDNDSINSEINIILKNKKNLLEFKLSEIEISINNDETDEKTINDITKLIEENGFDEMALKLSISASAGEKGNLGWINAKSLSKDILSLINDLKIGEVSKPIIKQGSAIFIKLTDKRNSNIEKINKDDLRKNLINKKRNELFNLYSQSLISTLKNSTLIEYVK